MKSETLTWALRDSLTRYATSSTTPDDFDDIIEFLASECELSGLDLDASSSYMDSDRTLEYLLAHPLTAVLQEHLVDLLGVSPPDIPLAVDEILDAYAAGPPAVVDQVGSERGDGPRICELCERPTALTEHHLIPRTEHDLFIKRGIFTSEECRKRIAMCCRPCHSAIHRAKSTRELASEYNTVEKLLELPEVARFAEWNSKRKVLNIIPKGRKQR